MLLHIISSEKHNATFVYYLDQFVKHHLKCRYYLRYCDDFVLLDTDPDQLGAWRDQIRLFLRDDLLLELNDRCEKIRPASDGVNFLGYIVRADYRLVRRRVVNNLRSKLHHFAAQLVETHHNYKVYRFDDALLEQCRATLASYLGHLRHADSFALRQSVWRDYPFLSQFFGVDPDYLSLQPLYEVPEEFDCTRWQYNWLKKHFLGEVLFFQVGCYYEFYHPTDDALAIGLGLKPLKKNRRGARFGFPLTWGDTMAKRIMCMGVC